MHNTIDRTKCTKNGCTDELKHHKKIPTFFLTQKKWFFLNIVAQNNQHQRRSKNPWLGQEKQTKCSWFLKKHEKILLLLHLYYND